MKSLRFLSCVLGLALASVGISACASSTSDSLLVSQDDPQRVICRSDINTGSRLPKKTCRTKAEWDELAAQTAELHRNLQRSTVDGALSSESK